MIRKEEGKFNKNKELRRTGKSLLLEVKKP